MPDRKNAAEANGKVADRSKTTSKTDSSAKDRQKDDGGTQNKSPKKRRKVNHGKHLFRACLRYPVCDETAHPLYSRFVGQLGRSLCKHAPL